MFTSGDYLLISSLIVSTTILLDMFLLKRNLTLKLLYLVFFLLSLAVGMLTYFFITGEFTVYYVWLYSNSATSFIYRVAGVWSGQEGTFLLWVWIIFLSLLWTARKYRTDDEFMKKVLTTGVLVGIFFLIVSMNASPFKSIYDHKYYYPAMEISQGNGLDPVLLNFWNTIHPPMTFIAYALLTMPFAFSFAHMWHQDRRWIMFSLPWLRNSGAVNSSPLSHESEKACWLCHGNGSEPGTHLTNMSNVKSCDDETYCHGNASLSINVISHTSTADTKYVRTSASITCVFCHNRTGVSVYNQGDTTLTQSANMSNMPAGARVTAHYIKNLTNTATDEHNIIDTVGWAGGSQGCVYCHRTNSGAIFNATNISQLSSHDAMGNNCYSCHIVGTTTLHDIGVINASQGGPDCVGCHGSGAALEDVNTTVFNSSIHAGLNSGAANVTPVNELSKACWACHGNGSEPSGHPNQTVGGSNPANVTYPLNCTEGKCHINGTQLGTTITGTQPDITMEHVPQINESTDIRTLYAPNCTDCHVTV